MPKIICVCGMGLGSGLIIKMTVQKTLEKLGFRGLEVDVEVLDVSTAQGVGCDLILTNHEFAPRLSEAKGTVIALNNLMSEKEVMENLEPYAKKWKKGE